MVDTEHRTGAGAGEAGTAPARPGDAFSEPGYMEFMEQPDKRLFWQPRTASICIPTPPHYRELPHQGGTRVLCSSAILQHPQPSGPFLSSTSSTKLFHFEHRIIHFLAGLPWSSSLWQPKASQTFICTTARWIPEKLFSLLCSWKHESQQRHNKLGKFIRARAVLSEPRGMERAAQCPKDETSAP